MLPMGNKTWKGTECLDAGICYTEPLEFSLLYQQT